MQSTGIYLSSKRIKKIERERWKDQRQSDILIIWCTYRYRILGMAYSCTVVRDIQRICSSVRWSSWRIWSRTAGVCHRITGRSCELSLTKVADTRAFKANLTKLLIEDDYPDVIMYDCILRWLFTARYIGQSSHTNELTLGTVSVPISRPSI